MITYRSSGLMTVIVFFAILLLILSTTPEPAKLTANIENTAGSISEYIPKPNLPKLPKLPKLPNLDNFNLNLLPPAAHKPPEQRNSTGEGSKWYSNWQWLNPYSSSITLDETRSVLPPLPPRIPIYTYYDSISKKDKAVSEADNRLLLAWRRAWFAQGFRPIVLGPQDAMKNPLYKSFHAADLDENLVVEFMSWMAWGHMGTGVFADWRCFPMTHYSNGFLSYLRRGSIPEKITRVNGLGFALFSGEASRINDVIRQAVANPKLKQAKTVIDLFDEDTVRGENTTALAYYTPATITSKYPSVAEKAGKSVAEGRLALLELVDSHLQVSFQSAFMSGISVLKPFPEYTTALIGPAMRLATLLAECIPLQMPPSCPPNNPKCQLCTEAGRMKISQTDSYKNESALFTIGTVPHPYTLTTLRKGDDNITASYIRRKTPRDPWLIASTKNYLGTERGASSRVVPFKDIVAGDYGASRGLWFTVETLPARNGEDNLPTTVLDELDWYFGFGIPRKTRLERMKEKSTPPKNGRRSTESTQSKDEKAVDKPSKLVKENELIEKARNLLKDDPKRLHMKEITEAWNLADTEIWRFVRAYRARSVVIRKKWEKEEKGFAGS